MQALEKCKVIKSIFVIYVYERFVVYEKSFVLYYRH